MCAFIVSRFLVTPVFGPALGCILFILGCLSPARLSVLGYTELSDDSLRHIPAAGPDLDIHSGALLAPILIPRVPGTPGSQKVQEHFVYFFSEHLPLWSIEWHNFTSRTPATGDQDVPFKNLILRRDPPWAAVGDVSRLTLVAHYDSLYKPEGFIGATDSAAPCALLMHVARSIDESLTRKWAAMEANGETGDGLEEEKGVQILLLDGEEAWVSWTDTDSTYGARALAASWEADIHASESIYKNQLSSISLFVLLDLLGAANPHIPSYFQKTHWAYQNMAKIESRMRKLDLLQTRPRNHFLPEPENPPHRFAAGYVLDDHVPFLNRGVDILHIIPTPFPGVWHTMDDDGEHLDGPTLQDWSKIVTAFAAEWMELDGLLQPSTQSAVRAEKDRRERDEL